ncbi:ABC transporter C-terminal domain-containing protein, partial [Halalkalibacterium ligniniphilum]
DKATFERDREAKRKERQRQRRIEDIEALIEELEGTIAGHEETLCEPDVFSDHEKASALQTEIDEAKEQIEQLMEEWETLQLES